jgi:hypothetical protein
MKSFDKNCLDFENGISTFKHPSFFSHEEANQKVNNDQNY